MNPGRALITLGLVLVAIGAVFLLAGKVNLPLGRLPGDIVWRGKHSTVYFPLVTCIVLSIVLTLLLSLFRGR